MKKRPVSITVIAWVLIAMGLMASASLIGSASADTPEARTHFFLMLGAVVVSLVTGISLLRGKSWGRYLFLGWVALCAYMRFRSAETVPAPQDLIVGAVPLVLMIALLFSEKANAFFSPEKAKE